MPEVVISAKTGGNGAAGVTLWFPKGKRRVGEQSSEEREPRGQMNPEDRCLPR